MTLPQERVEVPSRFRENEARGRRLGRPLRRLAGVPEQLDEELMARIGRGLTERDEPAGRLADAVLRREVSHAQVRTAIHEGLASVDAPAPELVAFMRAVHEVPEWVDWARVEEGARVFRRLGRASADVLLQLSLIGGYRFGGPPDLLVATGGLTGDQALRRLAETQHWATRLGDPGALRPGAEAWRLTVHVRVMHALVNSTFTPRWDVSRFGLPVNMSDQAGTLGLFDGTVLVGCRVLGVPVSRPEARAYLHLWRYVGWLMGVDDDFLTDDEHERHRISYHVLVAAGDVTDAGPLLAASAVEAQRRRRYAGWPRPLQGARGRYEVERLLSMLTAFVGVRGMRELGLPMRPPWAVASAIALNTWHHRVRGRGAAGRRRLERRGRRASDRILASYFGDGQVDVAGLP